MIRWLTEPMWRLIALIVSQPRVADWLIQRAQRTPYFHIDGYMQRWWLFNPYPSDRSMSDAERGRAKPIRWLPSVRIHQILREDRAAHHHDHPWNARTIVLRGYYEEVRFERGLHTMGELLPLTTRRDVGETAALRYGEFHHIQRVSPLTVWTLFITWSYRGSWGFQVGGTKVPHREYAKRYPEQTA